MANDRKITRADVVTMPSPRLKQGEALARELAAIPALLEPQRLPYDSSVFTTDEFGEVLPGPKLGYDISALPGRQRFHITLIKNWNLFAIQYIQ